MATFFLACFVFGLLFTVLSFILGAFGGSMPDATDFSGLEGIDGVDGLEGLDGGGTHGDGGAHGDHVSPFSASTISAFLAWFGGAGWLLARYSSLAAIATILLATLAGLAGGAIIFFTISRYVLPRLTELRPADFRVEGAVARVSGRITAGGVGEIVYHLGGNQQVQPARAVNDETIDRGVEVVIARIERGVAYVERWDRLAARHALPAGEPDPAPGEAR